MTFKEARVTLGGDTCNVGLGALYTLVTMRKGVATIAPDTVNEHYQTITTNIARAVLARGV